MANACRDLAFPHAQAAEFLRHVQELGQAPRLQPLAVLHAVVVQHADEAAAAGVVEGGRVQPHPQRSGTVRGRQRKFQRVERRALLDRLSQLLSRPGQRVGGDQIEQCVPQHLLAVQTGGGVEGGVAPADAAQLVGGDQQVAAACQQRFDRRAQRRIRRRGIVAHGLILAPCAGLSIQRLRPDACRRYPRRRRW